MGTMDSSAFRDSERKGESGKRDIYFNAGQRDGSRHGHVVEQVDRDGNVTYSYVRDVEGNVYVDDGKRRRATPEQVHERPGR